MIHVITGTDTDVGKTVATAALAARELASGRRVAVYKPTQTGVRPGEARDAQSIAAWLGHPVGLQVAEGIRLREPMAPVDAALVEGGSAAVAQLPGLAEHLARVNQLAAEYDTVLVEGAGGLLVELTAAGESIADLAQALGAALVVVSRPDLGTLNHTALTLEAAVRRGFASGTLLLGSYPAQPDALHRRNLENLQQLAAAHGWHWAGALPAGLVSGVTEKSLRTAGMALTQPRAAAPCRDGVGRGGTRD
ncbi:dethiobiotin synthase [Arthrobacter sp.]|uniref:dethiobiotin synthase n=1 Tax=Arthrobacter sp. TaxID=1667 RepID=UPI003A8F5EFF